MSTLPLLDGMVPPPVTVDDVGPDEGVVAGDVDEVLALPQPRMAWDAARIEMHRDRTRDLWMWSVCFRLETHGGGYRVGPKWHNFAETRDAALHWAITELLARIAACDSAMARRIRSWAEGLS